MISTTARETKTNQAIATVTDLRRFPASGLSADHNDLVAVDKTDQLLQNT